jgi:hypothetical protein
MQAPSVRGPDSGMCDVVCRISLSAMKMHTCSDGQRRLVCRDETLPRDSYEEGERDDTFAERYSGDADGESSDFAADAE